MRNIWIKICGMTSRDALDTAVAAQVDAVGFVFAPSTRQVTPPQARELSQQVPPHIARIAVMQHPLQSQVDEVLQVFKPDVLQIDWEDIATLVLPESLQVFPVLRATRTLPAPASTQWPVRFLFEGPVSGTGEIADWHQAAMLATHGELILAGGLKPANVAEAIRRVRPFGVDVSSGVEAAPGRKDPAKIIEFVTAARSAAAQLE